MANSLYFLYYEYSTSNNNNKRDMKHICLFYLKNLNHDFKLYGKLKVRSEWCEGKGEKRLRLINIEPS